MQCPNCKFYKVDADYQFTEVGRESVPLKDIEFDALPFLIFLGVVGGPIVWFIGSAVIGCIFMFIGDTDRLVQQMGMVAEIIWSLSVVAFLIYGLYAFFHQTRPISKCVGINYECRHCGYTWSGKD